MDVVTNARDELRNFGRSIYSLIALLVIWEVVGQLGLIHYYFLPPLSHVLGHFFELTMSGEMFHHAQLTIRRAMIGLAIAIAIGVPMGVLAARSRAMGWFWNPIIGVAYPIPSISFVPVFILWFGTGDISKIILVAAGTVWPIAINARNATRSVQQNLIWSAKMMGTSDRKITWKVIMPAASPGILTGIQIGLPVSLIVTFVFEMVAGGGGLGALQIEGVRAFETVQVYAAIIGIMIVGLAFDRGLRLLRAKILEWE